MEGVCQEDGSAKGRERGRIDTAVGGGKHGRKGTAIGSAGAGKHGRKNTADAKAEQGRGPGKCRPESAAGIHHDSYT